MMVSVMLVIPWVLTGQMIATHWLVTGHNRASYCGSNIHWKLSHPAQKGGRSWAAQLMQLHRHSRTQSN
jgi:hypothetical protein